MVQTIWTTWGFTYSYILGRSAFINLFYLVHNTGGYFVKYIQGHTFFLVPQDPIGTAQTELSLAITLVYKQNCSQSFVQQPGAR